MRTAISVLCNNPVLSFLLPASTGFIETKGKSTLHTTCIILFISCTLTLYAQEAPSDSTGFGDPSRTALSFERSINTFRWDILGIYSSGFLDWKTTASDHFLRTLIKSDRQNFKDENTFRWSLGRSLLANLDVITSFSSFIFSDQFSFGINDIALNSLTEGVRWLPRENFRVNSSAGIVFDRQQGIVDNGFIYEGNAMLREFRFGDSRLAGEIYSTGEYISPRFQQEQRANAELRTELAQGSLHLLQFSIRNIRRDFYLSPDSAVTSIYGVLNPISSRTEQILSLTDHVDYEIVAPLSLHGSIDLSQRTIENTQRFHVPSTISPQFDSDIREFRLMGNIQLRYNDKSGTAGDVRFEFNERDETHGISKFEDSDPIAFTKQKRMEEQKNNTIYQMQLSVNAFHAFSQRDTLFFAGSSVKLEYDTPESNPDDRDELFLLASMRWSHQLHEHLSASVTADLSFRHLVYIFSERSANNSWNRVFRFAPSVTVRYSGIVSINTAEVIGNYTVYDFEALNPDLQSFSFRLMTLSDSTEISLSRSLTFQTALMLRMYEQGELHWNRFTVRPTTFYDERTVAASVSKKAERWSASVGIRYFEQTRYRFTNDEKTKDNVLTSFGPTVRMVFPVHASAFLSVDGWYQLTSENTQSLRKTPNITLMVVWNI